MSFHVTNLHPHPQVKDTAGAAPGQKPPLRFGRVEVQPLLNSLFQGLFVILGAQDDNFENEYVMKCTMRVLNIAQEDVVQHTPVVLQNLNGCLERVCKNPRNPQFNHYLFEATAVLVRAACSPNPAMTRWVWLS